MDSRGAPLGIHKETKVSCVYLVFSTAHIAVELTVYVFFNISPTFCAFIGEKPVEFK